MTETANKCLTWNLTRLKAIVLLPNHQTHSKYTILGILDGQFLFLMINLLEVLNGRSTDRVLSQPMTMIQT